MIQTLRDFMAIEAGKPFAYGVSDCCLMVADWWQWVHGVDPAPELRGAYGTRKECLYLIRQYGSLANLMFSIANGVGAELQLASPASGRADGFEAVVQFVPAAPR